MSEERLELRIDSDAPDGERDEDELLTRALAGDAEAHGELFARMLPGLRAFFRRSVGKRLSRTVSSADLCQETFLRSLRVIQALPPDARLKHFRAALYRNARWLVADQARRVHDFQGESAAAPPEELRMGDQLDARGPVTSTDEKRWLSEQVGTLEPGLEAVVRLRMQGCSFAEIGRELGLQESTARKRFLRGALLLRERMQRLGG